MLSSLLVLAAETGEGHVEHELPMSPLGFGLVALAVFGVLLATTFAFRGVANRH